MGFSYNFFFIAVSSLLDYNLFTIINIQSLLGGLTAELMSAHVIPTAKVNLASLGVERADGCCLAIAAYQAHSDALRQFLLAQ